MKKFKASPEGEGKNDEGEHICLKNSAPPSGDKP